MKYKVSREKGEDSDCCQWVVEDDKGYVAMFWHKGDAEFFCQIKNMLEVKHVSQ